MNNVPPNQHIRMILEDNVTLATFPLKILRYFLNVNFQPCTTEVWRQIAENNTIAKRISQMGDLISIFCQHYFVLFSKQ